VTKAEPKLIVFAFCRLIDFELILVVPFSEFVLNGVMVLLKP